MTDIRPLVQKAIEHIKAAENCLLNELESRLGKNFGMEWDEPDEQVIDFTLTLLDSITQHLSKTQEG